MVMQPNAVTVRKVEQRPMAVVTSSWALVKDQAGPFSVSYIVCVIARSYSVSGRVSGSASSATNSNAFSLHAPTENPFPSLPAMIRHLSVSYSSIAVRSLWTCQIGKHDALRHTMPRSREPYNQAGKRSKTAINQASSTSSEAALVASSRTISSVHTVVFALSLVQYRTCNVPELRPGKKSAICFHVRFFVSFNSTSSASSSGVNFNFGPLGRGAGVGIPGWPTTLGGPCSPEADTASPDAVRCDFDGGG